MSRIKILECSPLYLCLDFLLPEISLSSENGRKMNPRARVIIPIFISFWAKTTVKPLITNTSEKFIKCRLENFSMSFILYYVNLSICENK